MAELNITKGYGLYGARSLTQIKSKTDYLIDLGINHEVIEKTAGDNIVIKEGVRRTYPETDFHFEKEVSRKIVDIADFCSLLTSVKGLQSKALVTITTLACEEEYYLALSAELELWLHHAKFNIYNCIGRLSPLESLNNDIAVKKSIGEANSEKLSEEQKVLFLQRNK